MASLGKNSAYIGAVEEILLFREKQGNFGIDFYRQQVLLVTNLDK